MRRIYAYAMISDPVVGGAFFGTQAECRAWADETYGLGNWREYEVTGYLGAALGQLVNLARERVQTPDRTGRWKWNTVNSVLRAWRGEATDETCAGCGQRLPVS